MGNRHSRASKASRRAKAEDTVPAPSKAEANLPVPPAQVEAILPAPAKVDGSRPTPPKPEAVPPSPAKTDEIPLPPTAAEPAPAEDAPCPTKVEDPPSPTNINDVSPPLANVGDNPAPPPRGEDILPSDVWRIVFKHLQHPVPAPLSRPPRSALRPKDHAALALTCKLFNTVVTPLLYHTVVTDSPGRFFAANVENKQLPFEPLPRHLLALVHSLYIEYQDTDTALPYTHLLQHGGTVWHEVTPDETLADILQAKRCHDELTLMYFTLHDHFTSVTNQPSRFPRLSKVSVGSIYGQQGDLWPKYQRHPVSQEQLADALQEAEEEETVSQYLFRRCKYTWDHFLVTNRVAQVCIRDPSGPLSFTHRRPLPSAYLPSKAIHFNTETPLVRFHPGQNPTWVSDIPQDDDWSPMYHMMDTGMTLSSEERGGAALTPLQLDIYGSTTRFGTHLPDRATPPHGVPRSGNGSGTLGTYAEGYSVSRQRAMAASMAEWMAITRASANESARASGRWYVSCTMAKDKLRWLPSHDYPGCPACGSGPPL